MKINKCVILMGVVCSLLLLSACATTAGKQNRIEERAMERWQVLLSGDFAGAYEYLSPGFRSSVSSVQYQRTQLLKRIQWTSADYIESDCEETVCNVKISLGFVIRGGLPGVKSFEDTQFVEESWILVDGVWYFVPEQ
mgnify:CR=1 FL=1